MKAILSLVLFGIGLVPQLSDDLLPRRGYFGVGVEPADGGARIFSVAPDSTAAAADIRIGDIIEAIDDSPITSPQLVVEQMGRHKAGQTVKINLRREGNRRTIEPVLKPFPFEQMANATLHYGSVLSLPNVHLRTILSVPSGPSNMRFPAVLLIPGGGCGSIDTPFSPNLAQPGLMYMIGSRGFVTMRIEKSGVGDSQGAPCDLIGFKEELAGYQAALRSLRSNPLVNPDRIYLLGISLGGVFAPLLAAETKVAGISVFGASSVPPPPYPGRSERFFQEFASVDVAGAWAKVATRVQVLHAEFDNDPYINRAAHETIAAIVKRSPGGSATFKELAGLDHCWTRHASLEASVGQCGQGQPSTALVDSIMEFLTAGRLE